MDTFEPRLTSIERRQRELLAELQRLHAEEKALLRNMGGMQQPTYDEKHTSRLVDIMALYHVTHGQVLAWVKQGLPHLRKKQNGLCPNGVASVTHLWFNIDDVAAWVAKHRPRHLPT